MKKNKIILLIIILVGILFAIIGFSISNLFTKPVKVEQIEKINPKIDIVIKSNERNEQHDMFYETDLLNYKLENRKKENVYIRFNDKDEFPINEVMQNNDTGYVVNNKKILRLLLDNNINYMVSSKYDFIDIGAMLPKNLKEEEIDIEVINTNQKAVNIVLGHDGSLSEESIYRKILYIICKNNGESMINIKISNNKTKEPIIDKKFKVIATISDNIYRIKYYEI